MYKKCDKRVESMIDIIRSRGVYPSVSKIRYAYEFAKTNHVIIDQNNQKSPAKRKDGSLYISHPVEVAYLLAEIGFEENIIIAALLHDIVEDTPVTIDEIKTKFGIKVSEIVNSVTAITYQNELGKDKADTLTDTKLYQNASPAVVAVKLSDRIHNLKTISVMSESKQHAKVEHTKKVLCKLAEKIGMRSLLRRLDNECLKISNPSMYNDISNTLKIMESESKSSIKCSTGQIQQVFNRNFNTGLNIKHSHILKNVYKVTIKDMLPDDLMKNGCIMRNDDGKYTITKNANIKSIIILFKKDEDEPSLFKWFYTIFNQYLVDQGMKILGISNKSKRSDSFIKISDKWDNHFRIYLRTVEEHQISKLGNKFLGSNINFDDDNLFDALEDSMAIYLMNGRVIYIPRGATALDLAFFIHDDLGLNFQYAIVNDKKNIKREPYTILEDGDKVVIYAKHTKNEDRNLNCNINVRWLKYVQTEKARNKLVDWFENQFDNLVSET